MEILLFMFVLVLGATLGSFSYCMSQRLIAGKSFLIRSHCSNCQTEIQLWDLIPIISYVRLKARCRACKVAVPKSYLYAELFVLGLSLLGYLALGWGIQFWIYLCLLPFLALAIFTDLKVQKVPDLSSMGIALFGVIKMCIEGNYRPFTSLLIMFFLMLILKFVFAKALHKNALGEGDFYLILASSLWINPLNLPIYIMIMGVLGMVTAFVWRLKLKSEEFPFAAAVLLSMLSCYLYF